MAGMIGKGRVGSGERRKVGIAFADKEDSAVAVAVMVAGVKNQIRECTTIAKCEQMVWRNILRDNKTTTAAQKANLTTKVDQAAMKKALAVMEKTMAAVEKVMPAVEKTMDPVEKTMALVETAVAAVEKCNGGGGTSNGGGGKSSGGGGKSNDGGGKDSGGGGKDSGGGEKNDCGGGKSSGGGGKSNGAVEKEMAKLIVVMVDTIMLVEHSNLTTMTTSSCIY
jgi:hypothetical protein